MRLRLSIQRHGLPTAEVLWAIRDDQAQAISTISQLLEQINDIIPLESEDWGLEDYVVQVNGFECLHFSQLGQVIKDEDVVTIRPLQTAEVRARTLSGRYQISSSGQHLIDGIPFGRPHLRRPDRPAVHIPPRKRRRLEYEGDDSDHVPWRQTGQLVPYQHEDYEPEDDSEEDEDFVPEQGYAESGSEPQVSRKRRSVSFNPVVQDQNGQALISLSSGSEDEDDEDFEELSDEASHGSEADAALESDTSHSTNEISSAVDEDEPDRSEHSSSEDSSDSTQSSSDDDSSDSEPEEISSKNPSISKVPPAPAGGTPQPVPPYQGQRSTQERNKRRRDTQKLRRLKSQGVLAANATFRELREWEDGPTGESTPDDLEEAIPEPQQQQATDIGDERSTPKPPETREKLYAETLTKQASRARKNRRQADSKKLRLLKAQGVLPPTAKLQDLRDWRAGQEDEPTANTSSEASPQHDSQQATAAASNVDVDFQQEREALLEALKTGGVDVTLFQETTANEGKRRKTESIRVSAAHESFTAAAVKSSQPTTKDHSTSNNESFSEQPRPATKRVMEKDTPPTAQTAATSEAIAGAASATTDDGPAKKRARLDIGSSRRLLFGSLGLRNPKTKEDEVKTREKLMAVAKPRASVKAGAQAEEPVNEPQPELSTDPDAWKSKIKLSAVECWDDDVEELSAPPFPFEQYWDQYSKKQPQQPYNKRKRKRKMAAEYQKAYQGDGTADYADNNGDVDYYYEDAEEEADPARLNYDDSIHLNYDDDPADPIESQLKQDIAVAASTQGSADRSTENIPPLPADISALAPLQESHLKPGALIVFKQLEVSQSTNWAPVISAHRTATVTEVFGTGVLHLSLASRDRPQKANKVRYDAKGRRLYDRFEMPADSDEDGDGEDAGFVEVEFGELLEPKLLRAAPETETEAGVEADSADAVAGAEGGGDESSGTLALSHASLEHEVAESHGAGREEGSASMMQSASSEYTWVEASA
ncbi:hypothetical protein W97_06474 [Coniosporium apollinis CBS 100218]|uniref:DUF7357 domain-containing protein n=1 Tax=Coniosporium apollinis (strain CBS 100218) TaxID=1168221 RepID=R7YZZ0_CONA1|nr:uncharacterized protein W97_06474 [Coniosporium apollinis CBS 100218]EON67221.1 hypothetical protein W97_06474 [Coniosporium apollinis CBS 100218]